jgi:hypothetical protein
VVVSREHVLCTEVDKGQNMHPGNFLDGVTSVGNGNVRGRRCTFSIRLRSLSPYKREC